MDRETGPQATGDTQINHASHGGYLLSVQRGDINVYQEPALFYLVPFRRAPAPLPDHATAQPSHLLATANRVVDFYGRHSELESLRAWRDAVRRPFAVQLHHAPGGQGKTRLMARFAELSADDGWAVAEAHQALPGQPHVPALAIEPLATGPKGVVIIVDYADRWPRAVLQALLLNPSMHRGRVRVVLLSRALGSWWTALCSKLDSVVGHVGEAVYLRPLGSTPVERAEIFRLARDRFASLLGVVPVNDIDPPAEGRGGGQELVLTLHMAALAAVYARKAGQDLPSDPTAVSAYLLRREVAHWFEMFDRGALATRPDVLARAAYAAVLTRALPPSSAVKVLSLLQIASGDTAVRVLDDHASCYPPAARTTVLEPIYPDQLAEDFYALQTPGHTIGWYEADVWVGDFTARLISAADDDAALAVAVPRMMLTLIEVARRWEHIAHGQLFPLLRERPDLIVRAGSPALAALAALSNLDLSVLEALASRLPLRPQGEVAEVIADLTQRLVRRLLERETNVQRRARLNLKLGVCLISAGRWEEALEPLRYTIRHSSGIREPQSPHRALLHAYAVGEFARVQAALGDEQAALREVKRAVKLWEDEQWRGAPRHVAASHLDLLAALMFKTGYADMVSATKAIQMWRFAAHRNNAHLVGLAESYDAMSRYSLALGEMETATTASRNAVTIWRRVANRTHRLYQAELVAAISRLSQVLYRANGDLEEAISYAKQATDSYRKLADEDVTFRPHLARCLAIWARYETRLSRGWNSNSADILELLDEAISIEDSLAGSPRLDNPLRRALTLRLYGEASLKLKHERATALAHMERALQILDEQPKSAKVREAMRRTALTYVLLLEAVHRKTDAASARRFYKLEV